MLLGLYLVGVAVPITLAVLTIVFWVLTKALKEYVTKGVNERVERLEIKIDKFIATHNANMDAISKDMQEMRDGFAKVNELLKIHDTVIREMRDE